MSLTNPVTKDNPYGMVRDLITPNNDSVFATTQDCTLSNIDDGPYGETILRQTATSPTATARANLKNIPLDLYQNGVFTWALRVNDFDLLTNHQTFYFRQSGGGSYRLASAFVSSQLAPGADGEWFTWQSTGARLGTSGSPPPFSDNTVDLDRLSLWAQPTAAGLIMDYGPLYGNTQHDRATIILSTDDSNDTDYSIFFEELRQRNLVGTSYQIGTIVGDPGRVTFPQLQEMQSSGVVEIGLHASSDMTTLTYNQQYTEIKANRDALIANNLNWQQFSYPLGRYNRSTLDALNALGIQSGRTVETIPFALYPGFNLYRCRSYGLTQTRVTDTTWSLDNDTGNGSFNDIYAEAKAQRLVMGFYVHRLQETVPAGSGQTHIGAFREVLNLIETDVRAGNVRVVTAGNLYREAKGLPTQPIIIPTQITGGVSMARTQQFGPYNQADGRVAVNLGFTENFEWHEITIACFEPGDVPGDAPATGVTGTLAGEVLKRGADQVETFSTTLNLATGERAWDPELSRAQIFYFTPTGFNATYTYYVTVNSWGDA